jgi:GNAT superfamily N-acetyltransferase
MRIRLLTAADVPATLALSSAAGWNQTPEDWRRMIELEPEACFGVEVDGELVATTTLLCYGTDLAWVGMVLTHPRHQRRGYARALVLEALDVTRARHIPCVKLDATDQGQPVYENVGFVVEQRIERWRREGGEAGTGAPFGPIPRELDRQAFGTDRSRFLQALGAPTMVAEDGYVMTRPGAHTRYLGPCVAMRPGTAHTLIQAALSDGPCFWDLLPANEAARGMATELGFQPVRRLIRMRLGEAIDTRDDYVFAIAGFEAG